MNHSPIPRRHLPLVVVLLLAGLLSFFVQDFFRQVIFLPIVEIFLNIYRFYRQMPQNLVWGVFLLFALALAVSYLLLSAVETIWQQLRHPEESKPPARDRVSQLAELADEARRTEYARWQLAREIEGVLLGLLAWDMGETAVSLQRRIQKGQLSLPPNLQAVCAANAAVPNYIQYRVTQRRRSRRKPLAALAALDLEAALGELERLAETPLGQLEEQP
jgi:hypothetical protein